MTHRFLDQPRSVWAVAFACVVAFMGIGLVDPILPVLAHDLDATPSEVSLLFTSYFAMTGISMLVTGWAASRFGPRQETSPSTPPSSGPDAIPSPSAAS